MHATESHLPQPPEMKRRVSIYPMQMVGMTLIILIPVLALLGFFGQVEARAAAASESFTVLAEYPERSRHRLFEVVTVTVTNVSQQPYDTVTVGISESYVASFAEVAFDIEVERITPEAYVFELTDFQPGDSRIIGIELRADQYGQRDGFVRVAALGAESVELAISTFVFP
jgi:hypothetical protein